MSIGKERYTKNVIYVGGAQSTKPGYGVMYLLGNEMMYYYEYVLPKGGVSRDAFMSDVMTHCLEYDGKMRVSFIFASNIIHSLTQIMNPSFIGMDRDLPPLPEDLEDAEEGAEDAAAEDVAEGGVRPLAGTENVPHEAIGSVDEIADTPIPFELWLFSIKKLGQNFMAATQNFERLDPAEQDALMKEYSDTFY